MNTQEGGIRMVYKNVNELKVFDLNNELFDDLGDADFKALKKDIAENGIINELHIIDNNVVLCGHQRLRVAKELGLSSVPVKIVTPLDNEEYAIKDNLLRRQLNNEQKGELFLRLADKYQGRKHLRRDLMVDSDKLSLSVGKSSELVAEEVYGDKSKARSIERAMQYAEIVREKPELKGKPLTQVIKQEKKEKALEQRKSLVNTVEIKGLIEGDALLNLKALESETVDCVIIDPPYNINFKSVRGQGTNDFKDEIEMSYLEETFKELNRVLKNDSHFYCFCGFQNVEVFKAIIEKYFNINNLLVWVKNNHTPTNYDYNYAHKYELIFFCNKGKRPLNQFSSDVLEFDNVNNKEHSCEKPVKLLKFLVENSTSEGELVLDCFAGSGSLAMACLESNRNFVLIEKEQEFCDLIKIKISEVEE